MQAKTPMLQQYFRAKAEYPEALLMMRVGDFYELYGEDAEIAARELEIVLTGRDDGKNGRVPMAGVPYHAVERYVARLVQKGYKVALMDQMEDPRFARGLVKRKVTRVLTPGTVLEDSMLDERANNYLVAAVAGESLSGLGVVDVSTGEFLTSEIQGEASIARIVQEIVRLQPAEVLVPKDATELAEAIEQACNATVTPYDPQEYADRHSARQLLLQHFQTQSLRGFGCEHFSVGLEAAAMLLRYLRRNQVSALQHIRTLATYSVDNFMYLDATARRNLELTRSLVDGSRRGTLIEVLDITRTAMGARLLRRWLDEPLQEIDAIETRLQCVQELVSDSLSREEIRHQLGRLSDLERLTSRAATGVASPRDLAALRQSLMVLPEIHGAMQTLRTPRLQELRETIRGLPDLTGFLARAIVDDPPATLKDGGVIRDGFHAELDAIRRAQREGKQWIAELELRERERTGIPSLKVGYNAVFGYYIEVSKPHLSKVPPDYMRKQTTANGERFITPALKEMEAQLTGAEERALMLEQELFSMVREEVALQAGEILQIARAIAELDVLANFAEVGVRHDYHRPVVHAGTHIRIRNGRHPVVERFDTQTFIPNDCLLNDEQKMIVLTGPNMSGKSTYLRQVALICLMAHIGSFVPADEAEIALIDRIFTRVGAHDELATGQSTFMVEMTETATILNHATERSLVVLDEIGRGTSTYDGLAIAWAVAEALVQIGCKTLFATHYHYLNELANLLPGVRNYRVAVKEQGDQIIWLHKVLPGGTDRSYGIQVARMAGIPPEVVARAQEILRELERLSSQRGGMSSAIAPEPEAVSQVKRQKLQLTLFEAEKHPVIEELEKLDVTTLTPIEALLKINEWKKRV
ncbi:MAG: DNA mismatch repair protein MutS [Armatimonadota bacterium]